MGTEEVRAVVLRGDGLVARYAGVLCVASCPDPAPLHRLLEICRAAAGDEPGRPLARRLAMWLGGSDAPPHGLVFGTVSAAGDATAVFLSGGVTAQVGDTRLGGADAAAWTDRLVPGPDVAVRLFLDGTGGDAPDIGLLDLREGVVDGGGVVIGAAPVGGPSVRQPPGQKPQPVQTPPVRPMNINAEPTLIGMEPAPDGDGTGPIGVALAEPPRPPLEAGEPVDTANRTAPPTPAAGISAGPRDGEARGHLCSRGHLNDPRSHFCVMCGIRMNERTGVLVVGARPPLGLLVFDDGATYTVDAEYLVGRMPEADDRVRTGSLRSIVVEDRSGAVSRVHAELRVDGWDVVLVDSGSRNGTFVAAPGDPAWTPVPPGQSRRLVPGMRVRLGGRSFVFESPSGVR